MEVRNGYISIYEWSIGRRGLLIFHQNHFFLILLPPVFRTMSKLLVVVGATGSQGRSVVEYFLQHKKDYTIRGLTRNPASDNASALSKKGVEMVQASLDDLESLKKAFAGANAIFAYTAFGDIVSSQGVMEEFKSGKVATLGQAAFGIELQQGKNVADAAASIQGVEKLVWSSLPHIAKWSGGKYKHALHFDAKAEVADYMRSLKGLEGKVNTVELGVFADDPVKIPDIFAPKKVRYNIVHSKRAMLTLNNQQSDGSFLLAFPAEGERPAPWIDIAHDLGVIVDALINAPGGINVVGASELLSMKEWLELWASHVGVEAHYEAIPLEVQTANDPTGMKRQMGETMSFVEDFGYNGENPDILTPDEVSYGASIECSSLT